MLALIVCAVLLVGLGVKHREIKHPSPKPPSADVSSRGVGPAHPASSKPGSTPTPFEVQFDEHGIGRGLKPRVLHSYDPQLPGYHVDAAIATLLIRPRSSETVSQKRPDTLVLAIRTSSPARPMLESFALIAPDVTVRTSLAQTWEEIYPTGKAADKAQNNPRGDSDPDNRPAQAARGTYFRFEVVGDEVRVTFLPAAMKLLQQECRVEWIDWYR